MRRFTICLLLVALAGGACTEDAEPQRSQADAQDAADEVISAWNERDEEALSSLTAGELGAHFLLKALRRAERSGQIVDLEVERTGEVEQPPPGTGTPSPGTLRVDVPYSLSWTSEAADEPVSFEGSFAMAYRPDADTWLAELQPDHLWPGFDDPHRFAVERRWLKRGTIVDRDGRPLARGAVAVRSYPQGSVAGTTVGHIEPVSGRDAAILDATEGDLVGASGLELAFQERLAGRATTRLLVVDRRGRKLEVVGRSKGSPGRRVRTTLDVEVQRAAEAAFGGTIGGAVVLDPSNGDLLAVVSSSSFDPNNYVGVSGVEPFNRALSGLYPPGSAMKVVTAAAALDTKTVTASSRVTGPAEYKGVRNFESGVFGTISFATAVQNSVNTAFAQVAEDLGAKKLTRYARLFGFNSDPKMALGAGTSSFPRPLDLGDLMWSSVGQAQVLATPLQMATVAATVANGGKRMEPRIDLREEPSGERAVSKGTATTMNQMMQSVVEGGTGTAARIAGVAVAGKTGTAEVDVGGERRNHAWFVSFAPAGNPKVAVAVVSEYGGVGGQVAAPLARAILTSVLPLVP